jgi:prepilin-type N-terminal cleavage/methylation domain-containing protein
MMNKGFTFIEVVFAVTIFLIVTLGVYESYRVLYVSMSVANAKILAASLINERFEIARNLPYTSVGTVGGTPSGVLLPSQNLVRDGINWSVSTVVINVDDPFDGSAPADTRPADYKLVEVIVGCDSCKNFSPLAVTGIIAPRNLEP